MPKIKIISYSESKGGAAKAARNFFQLLLEKKGNDVELLSVFGLRNSANFTKASRISIALHYFKMITSRIIMKFGLSSLLSKNSLNIFSSSFVKMNLLSEQDDSQVLHINWVNNETLSLRFLNKIFKNTNNKVILTLHDEWVYCATEHYADYNSKEYLHGYRDSEKLKKYIYGLKSHIDFSNVYITVPSSWLKERAEKSLLLKGKEIYLLPNFIDTDLFCPHGKNRGVLLQSLGLRINNPIILGFGAVGGGENPHKGFDLLVDALASIEKEYQERIVLVTFGADDTDPRILNTGYHVVNLGKLSQRTQMRDAYNLMDIMIVPSRVESFGQVAAESLACEVPVVAFEYSGITDIITHKKNGYLAKPFDSEDLAAGIISFINMEENERNEYGVVGRRHIVDNFGKKVIAKKYLELISQVEGFTHE